MTDIPRWMLYFFFNVLNPPADWHSSSAMPRRPSTGDEPIDFANRCFEMNSLIDNLCTQGQELLPLASVQ
ncbi:hypothetical protein CCL15_17065 [Pseudomonas syringae]|nr:hypothetical protein CCL15_17065 [Pseudomonas syringae]